MTAYDSAGNSLKDSLLSNGKTDMPFPCFSLFSPLFLPSLPLQVAHISFEIQRPSVMAPSALFLAVGFTGILGFCVRVASRLFVCLRGANRERLTICYLSRLNQLNVALCLAAPDIDQLPGISGNCFLEVNLLFNSSRSDARADKRYRACRSLSSESGSPERSCSGS